MFGCQIVLFTTRQNVTFVGERFSIAVHPILTNQRADTRYFKLLTQQA